MLSRPTTLARVSVFYLDDFAPRHEGGDQKPSQTLPPRLYGNAVEGSNNATASDFAFHI